jgi:hypothetical protein
MYTGAVTPAPRQELVEAGSSRHEPAEHSRIQTACVHSACLRVLLAPAHIDEKSSLSAPRSARMTHAHVCQRSP